MSFAKKIRTRTSITKILANYTSGESLITAVYDKNIIEAFFFKEVSGASKAWKDRGFFYRISFGCIPPETKGEILAHKGSQTTGATPGDYPAPWNRTPVEQRRGKRDLLNITQKFF